MKYLKFFEQWESSTNDSTHNDSTRNYNRYDNDFDTDDEDTVNEFFGNKKQEIVKGKSYRLMNRELLSGFPKEVIALMKKLKPTDEYENSALEYYKALFDTFIHEFCFDYKDGGPKICTMPCARIQGTGTLEQYPFTLMLDGARSTILFNGVEYDLFQLEGTYGAPAQVGKHKPLAPGSKPSRVATTVSADDSSDTGDVSGNPIPHTPGTGVSKEALHCLTVLKPKNDEQAELMYYFHFLLDSCLSKMAVDVSKSNEKEMLISYAEFAHTPAGREASKIFISKKGPVALKLYFYPDKGYAQIIYGSIDEVLPGWGALAGHIDVVGMTGRKTGDDKQIKPGILQPGTALFDEYQKWKAKNKAVRTAL